MTETNSSALQILNCRTISSRSNSILRPVPHFNESVKFRRSRELTVRSAPVPGDFSMRLGLWRDLMGGRVQNIKLHPARYGYSRKFMKNEDMSAKEREIIEIERSVRRNSVLIFI
jgi:hypothetical protein